MTSTGLPSEGPLLNAAGIGQDQPCAIHQPDERQVILRFNQHHIVNMTKNTIHRLADIRIQVNRIDNLHLRVGMGYLGQRQICSKPSRFPPVAGNQNHLYRG